MPETPAIIHKVMVPPGMDGYLVSVAADGKYTINDTLAVLQKADGTEVDVYKRQAVRHAIESAWKRGDEREHKNLFGYCQTEGKRPTNAEFITRMADYLLHDTTSFLS